MFTSRFWRNGLIGLVVVCLIALKMAHANSRGPESSRFAETDLLAGSGLPAQVRPILQRACRDCHSDNTVWPWYANIPPVSWQIRGDVESGRAFMNLSKWSEYSDAEQRGFMLVILAATRSHIMPPPKYVWMHRNAKLSEAELRVLDEWARAKQK
jgi:hypothetical protein